MYSFMNLDEALIGMCKILVKEGVPTQRRGMRAFEIPHPVIIEIQNPTERYITFKERKWNKYLPFAESLWMALGLNNLDVGPGYYVKNLYKYSDDGVHWRGGYGPRLRGYVGYTNTYRSGNPAHRHIFAGNVNVVDQFKYVIEALRRDEDTRQAIITVGDPAKDCFDSIGGELLETKDYPCTRSIQFMMVDGELNCTVYMRSNDVLFGFSAVNVFNFTWMQEYIARILGVDVGKYYHVVNCFHLYEEFWDKATNMLLSVPSYPERIFYYEDNIDGLHDFELMLNELFQYEQALRKDPGWSIGFSNDMFNDWAKVFYHYHNQEKEIEFINPNLDRIFNDKQTN